MKTKGLILLLAAIPGTAWAGGVSLPIRGVRALSMGGAFVAGADGVNALWYNPSRLDESTLGADMGLVSLGASFTPSAGDQAGTTVSNQGTTIPSPTFGFIYRVSDLFSAGIGAYAPYSGFSKYDENGPQRYSLVESDRTTLLYLNAGAAFRFGRFRIGGGVQNVDAHLKETLVASGYTGLFGTAQDPSLDVLHQIELTNHFNITGNIGASFDAGPVTFGLAVQLPYTLKGDANLAVRLPSSVFFDNTTITGDKLYVEVPFPMAVRGGVAWRITPKWMAEAAVNFENWSVQQRLVFDPKGRIMLHGVPGIGDYKLQPIVIDRRMKDTYSFHVGTDYQILSGLHLRGGAFYEPSAFSDATFSVAQLDDNKIGLAAGASYRINQFSFDIAASRVFQGTRTVTNSQLHQTNTTNPTQTDIVGNGRYESGYWIAGLGATWHIGADDVEE
jgi:long-subunit fatty acid transport protein